MGRVFLAGGKVEMKEPSVLQTVNITADNIADYFTVANSSYFFAGSGSVFTSNNVDVDESTAKTTLTALFDIQTIQFDYSYSSEDDYDKFTLTVGGKTVKSAVSGPTTTGTYVGSIAAGAKIVFKYEKDQSYGKYDDKCTFSNMVITGDFR